MGSRFLPQLTDRFPTVLFSLSYDYQRLPAREVTGTLVKRRVGLAGNWSAHELFLLIFSRVSALRMSLERKWTADEKCYLWVNGTTDINKNLSHGWIQFLKAKFKAHPKLRNTPSWKCIDNRKGKKRKKNAYTSFTLSMTWVQAKGWGWRPQRHWALWVEYLFLRYCSLQWQTFKVSCLTWYR